MFVFLTIDVECYFGDFEREVYGSGLGLEFILGVLDRYRLPATFFVEALGATRWGTEHLCEMCKRIAEHGHQIGLHCHPAVANISGFRDRYDLLLNQDVDTQARLLALGRDLLSRAGVDSVSTFRAGDLAANRDTLAAMRRTGFSRGSNRDLDTKCSTRSQLNDVFPVPNDISACDGVVDVPVSCFRSSWPVFDGLYRHLEISAVGFQEMRWALNRMASCGYIGACILTHPAEFFRWRRGRAVPIVKNCRRWEQLAAYVARHSLLRPVPMRSECVDRAAAALRPEIRMPALWSLVRLVEQVRDRA